MKPLAKLALTKAILQEQEPMDDNLTELLLSNKHHAVALERNTRTKPSGTKLQPHPIMASLLKKVAV